MDKADALASVRRLEELARGFGGPFPSDYAEFKRVLWSLRADRLQDSYFLEKVGSLAGWADIGFSTRKFDRYGGAERVTVFALGDCSTIRSLIEKHWP